MPVPQVPETASEVQWEVPEVSELDSDAPRVAVAILAACTAVEAKSEVRCVALVSSPAPKLVTP